MNQLELIKDTLSTTEAKVIMELRKLEAFGKMEITKDQNGTPDKFIITASVKKVLT